MEPFLFLRKNESYFKSGLKLNLTVMQPVLRLTRANCRTLPQPTPRCLRFYLTARSAREFIKKNHPSLSLPLPPPLSQRLAAAPSWTWTRMALAVAARPIRRRSLAPITCTGAGGARSTRHTRRQPTRAKLSVGGTGGGGAHTRRCC